MNLATKIELAAGLLLILIFGWLLIAKANLAAELATARSDAAALQIANDGFRATAQRQQQAMHDIQTATALRAEQAALAERRADKQAKRFESAAHALAQLKAKGDACQTAERLIDLYRQPVP